MTVALVAVLVVAVLAASVVVARRSRTGPVGDVERFTHAREITSGWSETYQGVAEPEQPEASEDKPELQHSVQLVEAA